MSSSIVIALIIIVLVALLGYAFITQTISKKRRQKQRLIAALIARQKDFKYLCNGFPEGFLSKALNLLVHQCLVDVTAQLASLEPTTKAHTEDLKLQAQKLEQIKRQDKTYTHSSLNNPTQIKEVKTLLQGLHGFISSQQQKGHLSTPQFKLYAAEIKQMTLRLSVDAYLINALQAEQSGKIRLALHFYHLAGKLLTKEESNHSAQQLSELSTKIAALSELEASEEKTDLPNKSQAGSDDNSSTPSKDEWERFENEEYSEPWKKKNVYD